MAIAKSLQGQKVLVTRPEQQAEPLCDMIESASGHAVLFPVIEIVSLAVEQAVIDSVTEVDMLIFVSRNAVEFFFQQANWPKLDHIRFVAVGAGTAKLINAFGINDVLMPELKAGSEGLLSLPELNDVANKKIMIVRGQGGRDLLANTLTERGAKVSYLELYQRRPSVKHPEEVNKAVGCDSIICTSVEGVENLVDLLHEHDDNLLTKPLIVVSERIKIVAEKIGFQRIMVTEDVSDEAILHRLITTEQ